jgi:hypothetical protein
MKEGRKRTYNPESKPTWPLVELEESIWQGLAKLDCVTVWFFWWNSKVMVSPGCAVIFEGSKVRAVPPTMTLWSLDVEEGVVEDAVVEGVALDAAGDAEEEEFVVVFPMAAAWNAANLLPGLMAKTMPIWQWPVWRQYAQTGLVSVTWNCACWKGPLVLFSDTGTLKEGIRPEEGDKKGKETYKPESKPPGAGEQGLAKEDCVAV